MTAIQPPAQRVWWKQPIHRDEALWIGIAFTWCLVMFFMMPYWHVYGKQNLSSET
jgi:cytochrome c oxidase subunit 2